MEGILPVQIVEEFHLIVLAHLARGADKRTLVVKGGCNLRFFHGSIRYSEDMDLDVDGIDPHVLRDRVRAVLASRPFGQVLASRGIAIEHVTEHKQTPTVQRWKFGLTVQQVSRPLPTKIEFSRRGLDDGVEFGSLHPGLIREHRLAPFMASHYGSATALRQKVGALAHRSETQARDIFDMHHLIAGGAPIGALRSADPEALDLALARATDVDFGVFKSQVLSYLRVEDRDRYDSADDWDTIVLEVVDALGRARR